MAQNEQTLPNAQDFIAAFTSCNMAAQEVSEQLLKGILLDTTHNMVHLQIQELQVRIETINKAQQEPQQHRTQNSMAVENQFNTSQNLYDIIGAQLKENVKDIKNVINRNIVAEDPEQDVKYAQLLDNNKVNNKILHTLWMAYKFRLFIFNGRTKKKSQYSELFF